MEQENQDQLDQLLHKLEALLIRQDALQQEITELKTHVNQFRRQTAQAPPPPVAALEQPIVKTPPPPVPVQQRPPAPPPPSPAPRPQSKSDLEKFIGENLINKIGIAITIIGVAIGAKYSIEHDLISPLTRIILGYLMGLGLLGTALWLRKNYENFSSVLLSGSMAIFYLITFFAYSFYGLIPQVPAFALMTLFTVFTVIAALSYNQQVIAHIGLVGAYAVPFLLSDGSGKVAILYSYMAIINAGILAIAIKRYWKSLFYSAFAITWVIFIDWYHLGYQTDQHFGLALTFATIFFLTFYGTFLAYKLIRGEKFGAETIIILLVNSFVFFGLGHNILSYHPVGKELLGLFTLCNALVHFIVCLVLYRIRNANQNLFYFVAGLVLVFITIAIPVQLDGHWVTIMWAGETALLFWIGRSKNIYTYERLSYAVLALTFISLLTDWADQGSRFHPQDFHFTPFVNNQFLTATLVVLAFGSILYRMQSSRFASQPEAPTRLQQFMTNCIPAILLLVIYIAFRQELSGYMDQLYADSYKKVIQEGQEGTSDTYNYDLSLFKSVWLINYSMLFIALLSFADIQKLRSNVLELVNPFLATIVLGAFLTEEIPHLEELRDHYQTHSLAPNYDQGVFHLWFRYISIGFAALLLFTIHLYSRREVQKAAKIMLDFILHVSILWILSSELFIWMEKFNPDQSTKLGLSILWGVYALFLIVVGIWKKKAYLRIGAIGLFAITLVKLFLYDLSTLNTIAKTIVFVSLGLLLLIISFLYQKYKNLIFDEDQHTITPD